jgi:hypothetical protein
MPNDGSAAPPQQQFGPAHARRRPRSENHDAERRTRFESGREGFFKFGHCRVFLDLQTDLETLI